MEVTNLKNFWKDGLSIDETRFSILGLLTVIVFIYILLGSFLNGKIDDSLVVIFRDLLVAFVGVNAINAFSPSKNDEGGN